MKKIDPKVKKPMIILGASIVGIFVVTGAFFVLMSGDKAATSDDSARKIETGRTIDRSSMDIPVSENYSDMSKKLDSDKAKKAEVSGQSYVPDFAPPPEDVKPVVVAAPGGAVSPSSLSAPGPTTYNTPEQNRIEQTNAQQVRDASSGQNSIIEYKMKRVDQLSTVFMGEGYSPVKDSAIWSQAKDSAGKSNAVSGLGTMIGSLGAAASGVAPVEPEMDMIIKTGDRVYASIDMSINTDEQSPVIATILSGKANGWTMFGVTRLNSNNTISIEFNKVALPSGKSAAISAFAIDPVTGRTSISGSVDHKILERFVAPALVAGMNAYGQIVSKQGSQQTVAPTTGVATVTQNLTAKQIRSAAIGAGVGSIAGSLAEDAKAAKPSVSTKSNLGIEVLFMNELSVVKKL